MDELTVFNIALTPFNIELTDLDKSNDRTVRLCRRLLPDAIRMAQREHNWTFLTVRLDMDYEADAEGVGCMGYSHGYPIPSGVFKLVDTGIRHKVIGNLYCTDVEEPEVYGMMNVVPEEGVPADWWALVAYALSYLLAPAIAPGSTLSEEILRRYTWVATGLVNDEAKNNRYED